MHLKISRPSTVINEHERVSCKCDHDISLQNKINTSVGHYFIVLFCVFYLCQTYCVSMRQLMLAGDVELNPGPVTQGYTVQPFPYMTLQSRLAEQGLLSLDVGGAGDCFFRAVSHQLYGDSSHHFSVRTLGVQYMSNNPERFIESNTEDSRLRYLANMSLQGTWADGLIIQSIADALNIIINITESNEGFVPTTIISPTNIEDNCLEINIGHLGEFHYVSTQRNMLQTSISVGNENDVGIVMNELNVVSVYSVCLSLIKSCTYWNITTIDAINEHAHLLYNDLLLRVVSEIPNVIKIYDADINMKCIQLCHGKLSQNFGKTLEGKILENTQVNTTGFVVSFNDISISCITQHNAMRGLEYFALVNNNEQIKLLQQSWTDLDSLIKNVCSFTDQNGCNGNYIIYFLSCSSAVTNDNTLRHKVVSR